MPSTRFDDALFDAAGFGFDIDSDVHVNPYTVEQSLKRTASAKIIRQDDPVMKRTATAKLTRRQE